MIYTQLANAATYLSRITSNQYRLMVLKQCEKNVEKYPCISLDKEIEAEMYLLDLEIAKAKEELKRLITKIEAMEA